MIQIDQIVTELTLNRQLFLERVNVLWLYLEGGRPCHCWNSSCLLYIYFVYWHFKITIYKYLIYMNIYSFRSLKSIDIDTYKHKSHVEPLISNCQKSSWLIPVVCWLRGWYGNCLSRKFLWWEEREERGAEQYNLLIKYWHYTWLMFV